MDRRRIPLFSAATLLQAGLASITGLGGCAAPRRAVRVDVVDVRLVAQNTGWQASYLVQEAPGTTDVPTGREVHVPLGADVRLGLTSRDYISDFRLPGLGLRDFAAPELPSEFRFRADRTGRFDVRGDELCGLPHTEKSRGTLIVEDAASFRRWFEKRRKEADNARR